MSQEASLLQQSNQQTNSVETFKLRSQKTQDSKRTSVSRRLSSISTDQANRSHARLQSIAGIPNPRNMVRYENTYKLDPDADKTFNHTRIKDHATELMENLLSGEKYDPVKCPRLSKRLAESINQIVKQLPNPRFKLVTVVFMGERKGQDLRIASRCLWDTRYDNSVTITYEKDNLFATAVIYGLYFE